MDGLLYPTIINMSRSELYQTALNLADDLGYDTGPLRRYWRQSTSEYWRNEISEYRRNIRNRNNNFNRALRLSRETRIPLSVTAATNGTDVRLWRREVSRIRARARRNPPINRIQPVFQQLQRNVAEREIARDYDRLITRRAYQTIFNQILTDETTLTTQQATRLINLLSNRQYQIRMDVNGSEQFIPINDTTRDFIMSILTNGFVVEEGQTYGSDTLDNIIISDIDTFEIMTIPTPDRVINRDAAFFPYVNTTNLDLSSYQIYNQEQTKIKEREHCLIHTLLECGIPQSNTNEVKMSFVNGCNFRKKDLSSLPKMINSNIILHELKPDGKIKKTNIGRGCDNNINIAIHSSHFFKFETTMYSRYFINNYEELKDIPEAFRITKIDGRKGDNKKINSLSLVDKLMKQDYFKKLDMSNFEETSSHTLLKEHIYLDNIEKEQQSMNIRQKSKTNDKAIFFADCESFVYDVNREHYLYLLGVVGENDDYVKIFNVMNKEHENRKVSPAQDLIHQFLNKITKTGKQDACVYFHNLKYDYHLLEPYINIKNKCEKDNQIYSVTLTYKKRVIELRDSYKLIPFALEKFQKEFNLEKQFGKKEAICYEYYREDNNDKECKVETYRELLSYDNQKIFDKNMRKEPTYNFENKSFNPTSYYMEYLRLDCLVLKKGLQKFNNLIEEITDMTIYDSLTISSLTDKYFINQGAYDNIYEVKGNLRAYIAKAVYGGRVCVNDKYKKKVIEGKISDYDGVSLYPSAINRLCREIGLPCGKAKRYDPSGALGYNWKNKIYSILTVKITKVNKKQQMPFIAHKGDGIINYSNDVPENEIVIDSITLGDYIKFHEIEYEIIDGVYWDEGVNKKMGEIVQQLFSERLKIKQSNKALANVIKLMLNSAYGKTIMKKTNTEKKIIKTSHKKKNDNGEWIDVKHTNFNNFVYNNFNTIKSYRRVNESNFEVESICCDNTYNRGHVGCAILSMSKRIMNEVFDVANDNNYPIYYTDTDSLHCNYDDVIKLEEKYEERYGRVLNGKQLEQFHTDFDLGGACGEIYATKSIFLGKKSYIDILESVDEKGAKIQGHHIRLKGITEEGLEHTSKKYDDGYFGLYNALSQGKEVKIILNPYNESKNSKKVLFEFGNGKVSTRKEFSRRVKF